MQYDILRIVSSLDTPEEFEIVIYHIEYLDENGKWKYLFGSASAHMGPNNKQFVLEQARELLEYDE